MLRPNASPMLVASLSGDGVLPVVEVCDVACRAAGCWGEGGTGVVADGEQADLGDRRRDAEQFSDLRFMLEVKRRPRRADPPGPGRKLEAVVLWFGFSWWLF